MKKLIICSKCKKEIHPGERYSVYPVMKKTYCEVCDKRMNK